MPWFNIVPANCAILPMSIDAPDAAGVLEAVRQLHCYEADVNCDGAYCFSAVFEENGFWRIFERESAAVARAIPLDS